MCGCVSVRVCDTLAPSCLRLAPHRSLHTTLFLTHCLREEAGDAWASEVQHNEKYAHAHTYTVTKSHTCAETPRRTHPLLSSANRHCARTHVHSDQRSALTLSIFPKHQTSILLSSQTLTQTACLTLYSHPSLPWHWVTQIQQVTLGQWAVNELILITVNSITSERVCLRVCLLACLLACGETGQA